MNMFRFMDPIEAVSPDGEVVPAAFSFGPQGPLVRFNDEVHVVFRDGTMPYSPWKIRNASAAE